MRKLSLLLLLLLIARSMFAVYVAEISSLGDYEMKGKKFYILPGDEKIPSNDLEFMYFKEIITQCLLRHKAIQTEEHDYYADVCIFLDYSIEDASYVATRSVANWGPKSISSIETTSSGKTYVNYNYGVTGYTNQSYDVESYRRELSLYAFDAKSENPVILWETNVVSSGYSNDLQRVFPYMAQLAFGYMGESSKGKISVSIEDEDPDVLSMKQRLYLHNDVVVNPLYNEVISRKDLWIRAVQVNGSTTNVMLMAPDKGKVSSAKITEKTYIVYKRKRYPVNSVKLLYSEDKNYLNKTIRYKKNLRRMISLDFPVNILKGDTFDLVSYSDKDETEELFLFKNIKIE